VPETTPKPIDSEKYDNDLDDCMSCQFLFDHVKQRQQYVSHKWYYTTLVNWCGVDAGDASTKVATKTTTTTQPPGDASQPSGDASTGLATQPDSKKPKKDDVTILIPPRTDLAFNLYPTCWKLFANETPLVDDVIRQIMQGWSSEEICRTSRLCVLSSLELQYKLSWTKY